MDILFVCTGNICRSPMAEAIFEDRLARGWPALYALVRAGSAGIAAMEGSRVTETAVQAMDLRGLDISQHRARVLDLPLARSAFLIVTMAREHLLFIERLGEDLMEKSFTLPYLATLHDEAMSLLGTKRASNEWEVRARLLALREWLGRVRGKARGGEAEMMASDIIDPIGASLETYLTVADAIEEALERLMPMLFGAPEDRP